MFKFILKLGAVFVSLNLISYTIGAFLALNYYPLEWWLFHNTVGRITFLVLEFFLLIQAGNLADE